ncbi:PQQ-binding-like beta-propeller repeat protein [Halomicrobium salinisoli]|uniref:outer membrane protein assembly factor BamB family protein n=1 Tax=Halomicrobium salinisoli TaxID=2878391 RepID=UPI001CEFFFD7|nr:PQQ-binding-like beta-propeller repeat protein [Halomicrobium salinisoli]
MSSQYASSASLGEAPPARSRHQGRRSAVVATDEWVVAGLADGGVVGFDHDLTRRWRWKVSTGPDEADPSVVAAAPLGDTVVAGERSARGEIRCHDAATGEVRWRLRAADDVGGPQKDTRFFLPFVASLASDGDRCYAAARRYERTNGGDRHFESAVYAIESDGSIAWTYETDASPISVDVRGDRVGVTYNRCPGEHQHGLVVLDAADGSPRWMWDPGTEGQRRAGDVSLLDEGAVVASHGDYCGYRLGSGGAERWRLPLATPADVDGETVYAYPNHVHATGEGAVFVTGNTYPEEGRETEARHPDEHTAVGVSLDGEQRWSASVGGFASGVGAAGSLVAVPGAQHFRDRDADAHALRLFDVERGQVAVHDIDGVAAAAAVAGDAAVAVEEPVVYHDEGTERGAYRLHRRETSVEFTD